MTVYFVRRILGAVFVLFMTAIVSYAIVALLPGDYYTRYKLLFALQARGDNGRQEAILALRGLDKPWYTQFFYWVEGIVRHGSLGFSFGSNRPVTYLLLYRGSPLWWTLIIVGSSIIVGWIVGIPLGMLGAAYYRSPLELVLYSTTYVISAIPPWTLALLFFILYNMLHPDHWLLPGAWGIVKHELIHAPLTWEKALSHLHRLTLTWLLVSTPIAVTVARHLRAALTDTLTQPYIVTARGKGLSNWLILSKHALRNAMNPLVSMSGFMLTNTITNSIVATIVLYQPSLGWSIVNAAKSQDQPLLTGILLVFSAILVISTLVSDIFLAMLDPHIRYN